MRVLVIGGAGFIGRWVVKRLLEQHEVVVLDNYSRGKKENLDEFAGNERLTIIEGSITDRDIVKKSFEGVNLCLHLASTCDVQLSIDDPEENFDVDVVGGFYVLEECRKQNIKIVFVSTCMVYGKNEGKALAEDMRTYPVSPYAAAKIAMESMALSYYETYDLPVVVLRPFNTYGPYGLFEKNRGEGGVVMLFLKRLLAGETLNIYGDGKQTRDFLYVEDCADFILTAALSDNVVGEIVNAGTGVEISINELAEEISGTEGTIQHVKHHHPDSDVQRLLCDMSKVEKLTKWKPSVDLKEGIRRTKEWMRGL